MSSWLDPLVRADLARIAPYRPHAAHPGVIRLDANESPFTLPASLREQLAFELARIDLNRYPDVGATKLRESIATREGVHPDRIVIGCGSDEVIALLLTALSKRRGKSQATVLSPAPSFVMYRVTAIACGLEPVEVPLDARWDLDVDAWRRAIDAYEPNVIFLPSPNNPTGNVFARDRIEAVVDAARGRSLVVLDEAYGAFASVDYRAIAEREEHVARLQTLSKLGVAAARVGWAILPPAVADLVDRVRQPYNLNALSQRTAELAMGEFAGHFAGVVATLVRERNALATALASVPGVTVHPSDANFVWADTGRDAGELHRALLARGILVRSFHAAGGALARHVRITVGTTDENAALIAAWRAELG